MPNNKKIGNQTGSVPLPTSSSAGGSFVSNETARFLALNLWPKPTTGLAATAGDYVFALSEGTVTAVSGVWGFIPAYGIEASRSAYSILFDRIGTNYGNGDGTTSFNVPEVWGDYGYLKGASTPSGVTASGCLPFHSHSISCKVAYPAQIWYVPQVNPTNPRTIYTSIDGERTNEARHKEVVPLITSAETVGIPVGCAIQFMLPSTLASLVAVLPSSVLIASGQAVSRTGYDELFARLGTAYGSGDGSTTFNIPDLRGVFLRAPSASKALDPLPYITGSGYAPSATIKHRHSFEAYTNGVAQGTAGGNSGDGDMTAPASGPSNIGSVDGRGRNFLCLNCIVASGTI
jgi:microcystin-dependent protein